MSRGQHLALGLILAILLLNWTLPDKNGNSKLLAIIKAATGAGSLNIKGILPVASNAAQAVTNLAQAGTASAGSASSAAGSLGSAAAGAIGNAANSLSNAAQGSGSYSSGKGPQ